MPPISLTFFHFLFSVFLLLILGGKKNSLRRQASNSSSEKFRLFSTIICIIYLSRSTFPFCLTVCSPHSSFCLSFNHSLLLPVQTSPSIYLDKILRFRNNRVVVLIAPKQFCSKIIIFQMTQFNFLSSFLSQRMP